MQCCSLVGWCAPRQQEQQQGCHLPFCLGRTDGCCCLVLLNCVFESCCPDFEHMVLFLRSVGLLMSTKLQARAEVSLCADLCMSPGSLAGSHHTSGEMVPSSITNLSVCTVLGLWMIPECVSFGLSFLICYSQTFPFPCLCFGMT